MIQESFKKKLKWLQIGFKFSKGVLIKVVLFLKVYCCMSLIAATLAEKVLVRHKGKILEVSNLVCELHS